MRPAILALSLAAILAMATALAVLAYVRASSRRPAPPPDPEPGDGIQPPDPVTLRVTSVVPRYGTGDAWPVEVLANVTSVTTRPWDRWDGTGDAGTVTSAPFGDDRDWLVSMRASYLGPAS